MEFPLRGTDGTFRWFLTRVNPMRDAEGRVVRWFGANTDVDRVKRAEASACTVDDEPDARELVRRILSRYGAEALLIIPKRRPHVLVMDIGMPGEDGYSAIRRVRQLAVPDGGDVPAIALTAFARSEDRRRAVLAGFQMHTSKPVEPAELVAMIASLGRRVEVRATEPRS